MATLAAIRERRRTLRLEQLAGAIADVLPHCPGGSVWLFGSLAQGDWDGLSDVDLLAVAPDWDGGPCSRRGAAGSGAGR